MIREAHNGSASRPGPGKPTGLVAVLERLADQMAEGRGWMDSKKAAEFIDWNHSEFKEWAAAGKIPRHELGPRTFRYYAPELTEWLLNR